MQPTKHSGVMSIWLSAISPTKVGSVAQVVPTTDGLTNDQLCRDNNNNTPPADLWRRSTTRGHTGVSEWRYGPRRLPYALTTTTTSFSYIVTYLLRVHWGQNVVSYSIPVTVIANARMPTPVALTALFLRGDRKGDVVTLRVVVVSHLTVF